jgi:hypothetical protein
LLGYTRLESRLLRIKETRLKPRIPVSQSEEYWRSASVFMNLSYHAAHSRRTPLLRVVKSL